MHNIHKLNYQQFILNKLYSEFACQIHIGVFNCYDVWVKMPSNYVAMVYFLPFIEAAVHGNCFCLCAIYMLGNILT